MLHAAKCYWPGVTEDELDRAAASAIREAQTVSRTGTQVRYLGSLLFPDDELVLCLFAAASQVPIRQTTEHAGIPCERLMQTLWIPSPNTIHDRKERHAQDGDERPARAGEGAGTE
jgi:hypothetical protein